MRYSLAAILSSSLILSACAMQEGDFPSLAKRAVEDIPVDPVPDAPDPELVSQLPAAVSTIVQAALAQSDSAHREFLAALPDVGNSVTGAAGAAPASEAWVQAQMRLSALETDRAPSVSALADLDLLYFRELDQEFAGGPAGVARLVDQSRARVIAQVAQQQREIDRLKSGLR